MRHYFPLIFWLMCWGWLFALQPLAAQGTEPLDRFKDTGSKLKTYALEYKEMSDADAGNKGASILKLQLEDVVTAMEGYLAGTLERDEMAKTAASALAEARKYNTPKAKEVARLLTGVQAMVNDLPPKQPQNNTVDTPEGTAGADTDEGAALQVDPQLKRNIEVKDAGTGLLERYMVYLLFGLYVLAILLLGFVLAGIYKKRVRHLKRALTDLEARMELMTERKENGGNYTDIVQKDLMKRWELLENNTIEFIARVEEQLKDLQKSRALSNKHLEDRMSQVEAQLSRQDQGSSPVSVAAEAPVIAPETSAPAGSEGASISPPRPPAASGHQAACAAISRLLRELPLIPGVEEMDTLAADLSAAAQRPNLNLNLKPLAEVLQLLWLRAQFEKVSWDAYQQLKQQAESLNLRLEDQMAGRMSFSEFYADNIPVSQISPDGEPMFPVHEISNEEVVVRAQTSTASADAVKNTVLLTLFPTVVQLQEGAKTVLARGYYVVYG
ncbi:MAG: hypothetical protein KF690_05425 [Bacteroidetes bacterium]|nr:hypothetical protein [Bacteroidota bacterium]